MKKHLFIVVLAAVIAASALFAGAGSAKSTNNIHLIMGYIPNVQFAPWYVAQEKGYFADAGLNVEMDYGKVNDVMRLLAAGKVDFAIAGGDEVLAARSQGLPVTYIMALYARFPAVVVSLADRGISYPAQLKGKTIGIPGFYGTNYIAIKAVLRSAGLSESDVTLRPIGYTQVASLTQNKVDAVVGFANNEPVQLKAEGYEVDSIAADEYFDLVGHGVVAGSDLLLKKPEVAKAFVQATLKGMQYALDHPEEAFEICRKNIPELNQANWETQYQVMLESFRLWESSETKQHGLGYSKPQTWEDSQELLLQWGLIPTSVPAEQVMTNKFLP